MFRIQNKLDHWRKVYKQNGLKPKEISLLIERLRLGMSPVALLRAILFEPNLLKHFPLSPTVFKDFDERWISNYEIHDLDY